MRVNRQFNERLKVQVERSKGTGEWQRVASGKWRIKKWRDARRSASRGALRASEESAVIDAPLQKAARDWSLSSRRFLDFGLEKAEAVVRF
jgi:hypothetical protein